MLSEYGYGLSGARQILLGEGKDAGRPLKGSRPVSGELSARLAEKTSILEPVCAASQVSSAKIEAKSNE